MFVISYRRHKCNCFKPQKKKKLPMHILDPSPSVDFIEGHASHLKDPSAVLMNPTGHFSHVLDDLL